MKEIVWARIGPKAFEKIKDLTKKREISVSEYIRQLIIVDLERKCEVKNKAITHGGSI